MTFGIFDQPEITQYQTHHVISKDVMFTVLKHRYILELHRVVAHISK